MKNALISRDLIKKQLPQKQNVSNEVLFIRGRTNNGSYSGMNKGRSKSRASNKS